MLGERHAGAAACITRLDVGRRLHEPLPLALDECCDPLEELARCIRGREFTFENEFRVTVRGPRGKQPLECRGASA